MTRDELQRRMDALCAVLDQPAGTLVVSARQDDLFGWIATAETPDVPSGETYHPLSAIARGETEEIAYDSAWRQATLRADAYFDDAAKRLTRAEMALAGAEQETALAADALQRAGALRRAVRS